MWLRRQSPVFALCVCLAFAAGHAHGQCVQNHYVVDGLPSSLRDCQPLANLVQLPPDQMSPAAQALVTERQSDLIQAASFFGYDLNAPGWAYQQTVSPLLQKHIILSYTNATPAREASHFVAVVPSNTSELVQIVPAFTRGKRLFDPNWEKKGTLSVYNRLQRNEGHYQPIATNGEWINYAALYIALTGGISAIPTETDSIQATWNLAARHATTPVIMVRKNGSAVIACSDIADPTRTLSWKLSFDKFGQIEKAEREDLRPRAVLMMQTKKEESGLPALPPSALNP